MTSLTAPLANLNVSQFTDLVRKGDIQNEELSDSFWEKFLGADQDLMQEGEGRVQALKVIKNLNRNDLKVFIR